MPKGKKKSNQHREIIKLVAELLTGLGALISGLAALIKALR